MKKYLILGLMIPFLAIAGCEKNLQIQATPIERQKLGLELPKSEDTKLENPNWYVIIDEKGLEDSFVTMKEAGDDTLVVYAITNEDFEAMQRREDRIMAFVQKVIERFNLMKEYYEGDTTPSTNGDRNSRGPENK